MITTDPALAPVLRDDNWLAERVSLLRQIHFADVPEGYPITTRFGIRARNRFGSIGAKAQTTIILVNRLFADPFVPTFVVDGTLAHELAHYAHGFGSGLPKLYVDPHRGGIVDRELELRGLGELNCKAEQWRNIHWDSFYETRCADLTARRSARQDSLHAQWNTLLSRACSRSEQDLSVRLAVLAPRFGFSNAPFRVEWLRATRRQMGTSYWYTQSRLVRLHGLLADQRVPASLVDFEIGYWLARSAVGDNGAKIRTAMASAKLESTAEEALRWRRKAWTAFCNRNHPLKP